MEIGAGDRELIAVTRRFLRRRPSWKSRVRHRRPVREHSRCTLRWRRLVAVGRGSADAHDSTLAARPRRRVALL